ncbi:hypothetical protein AXK56_16990 [Tsukamurella pulmonis]|uniref:DUF4331 domain-containing protein n=1 Tax=Tsukamurella pulmonis TaxID=47312 RepID=A0A1H1HVH6_9ACTN|nr:DUF4331 family protein [Tsukamurella pulmonis]KXO94360.1 hypothetical protein AXK56_16990 [Tsukamurella pulmonis]SDR29066.1 protein of unknown function [Tsukamurella pulmonis]SUP13107.1 Uncharacterised protein [Tsukamurella pulmonis]
MSHHFDIPSADEDPRLNITDFYLFEGGPDTTVMAMAVNPVAAEKFATAPFRDEGLYAFRFDTDGDDTENLTFKFRFDETVHVDRGNGHAQQLEVVMATGDDATKGADGELLAKGLTGETVTGEHGVRAYAAVSFDAFGGDHVALDAFQEDFARGEYRPDRFQNKENGFDGRSVATIVLEVPNSLLGGAGARVHSWATVSLYGHAPEQQVNRWGLPLFTHIFLPDAETKDAYNRTAPSGDNTAVLAAARTRIAQYVTAAKTSRDPEAYADRVLALFGATTLPYVIGSFASFDFAGINGRSLSDNVMDNALVFVTNSALGTGIAPNPARMTSQFPFFVDFA